ncbi:MAG: carboxypeptidase regulatory-like domain-containing protein, partial [Pelosinus sp.]|nr:carboxypeptidase regulatory-like domain-containing protein [Pelosinus sp.]
MVGSKRANKVFAVLLILVMFLTNPVFLGPIYAANTEKIENESNPVEFQLDAKKDAEKKVVATAAADNTDEQHLTEGEKVNRFVNRLIPYYLKNGKKNGPEWLKTTDFEVSFTEDYKPQYSFTTVQPFGHVNDKGELMFWQGRYAKQSNDATANIGVGWRKLAEDKQSMIGYNLFYDYGFQYNLSRIGAGAEYFNKLAEYRANVYVPTSKDKLIGTAYQTDSILCTYIRAVEGFDFEAGTSFTHARWLSLYASGYFYDNKHQENETGYRLRSVFKLTPQFTVEAGYDKSNVTSGSFYGKFAYRLADGFGPSLKSGAEKKIDLSAKFLQKVERNNTIKTETFTKFVPYQGSISVTVVNANGDAVQGAKVQAYQNGSAVGSSAVTNAAGAAILSGLNVGTYTVKATYIRCEPQDSAAVTVQRDQTTPASVQLPITGGNAVISVLSSGLLPLSGATVTAVATSEVAEAGTSWLSRLFGIQKAYAAEEIFTLTLTTGADGTVQFKNLPPGHYKFTVTYRGEIVGSSPLAVPSSGMAKGNVVMTASGSSGVGSAAITVKDQSGTPLSGVTVSVPVDGKTVPATTTDKGVAYFSSLPIGSYTFTASKAGYSDTPSKQTISNANTTNADIVLPAQTGTVNITVTNGASINPSFKEGSTTLTPTATSGNVYTFTVTSGVNHMITVSAASYNDWTVTTNVASGGTDNKSVTLTQSCTVNITVTNGSGISPSFKEGTTALTPTSTSGNVYTFTLLPGAHTITVSASNYNDSTVTTPTVPNG